MGGAAIVARDACGHIFSSLILPVSAAGSKTFVHGIARESGPSIDPSLEAGGGSNQEIARHLDCSLTSVERKLRFIRKRLARELASDR
jgi:hypothetical protein